MRDVEGPDAMREGMRRLASGVCVISSIDDQGNPCAMTATSVTSVSDAPPSLLVCVNRAAKMYAVIGGSGRFCVNLLRLDQETISNLCSVRGDEGSSRFQLGDWRDLKDLPYLGDCEAVFTCRNDEQIDYGTHGIFIGRIERVQVRGGNKVDPLLYLNGRYGSFN